MLNVISHGYTLPLNTQPPPFFAKNNSSSLRNRDFVESEILSYLEKSYIQEINSASYCCNPLTVAEGKKLRLVLDLRHVNKFLNVQKFRYEDLKIVADLIENSDYFTVFDLVSGYHHIDINPEHFKFLGFQWIFEDGCVRNFQFLVLVFGLSTACYLFTKILKPLLKRWRLLGYRIAIYLDDGINISSSFSTCIDSTRNVIKDLESAGFVINLKKSNFTPRQKGEWLGTTIDTVAMSFSVPDRKITELKQSLSSIRAKAKVTARNLSQVAGQLSSMHMSLGPIVRLFTRSIYSDVQNHDWDILFYPSSDCVREIQFWLKNIDVKNGYAIKPKQATSQILFTDASEYAYGGYLLQRLGKIICHGRFDHHQVGKSSTERELLAIKYCLESFAQAIRHEAINIRTDNFSASRILEIGSPKPHLQALAIRIFEICVKNDIRLFPTWIPRELNQHADYYSKLVDSDDWTIDDVSFKRICKEFGHPTVDRFADNLNRKVSEFNSKFYCPGSSAIDSFTQDWSCTTLNWLSPPIKYLIPTIRHLRFCKGKGILIVPQWPSSHFWPVLHNGVSFQKFIKRVFIFQPFYYSNCEHTVFKGYVNFNTLALLIDFSLSS